MIEVMNPCCCGLDVHKKTVVAHIITPKRVEGRSFGTMTADLIRLREWLVAEGVTHVAMESTGSYWKPIYNLLEGTFELVLANAREIKTVPGRKSDVKDAEWIASLLRHGLLRPSYVPSREERELRELTRYRQSLVGERTAEINRVQKVLEGANIKLSSVISDVVGQSGRAMLRAMVDGVTDPAQLAQLRGRRLKATPDALEAALLGLIHPHQRFILKQQLRHIAELDRLIDEVSEEVAMREAPFEEAQRNLETIPGIGKRVAEIVLSELGPSVERFPTAGHLSSWAGLSPGLNESAGKRLSSRTTNGNGSLRVAMVQAAHAAARTKTHIGERYRHLAPRLGTKKAAIAVARSILVAVYAVLKQKTVFRDLGVLYLQPNPARAVRNHLNQLKRLGAVVDLVRMPA